MAFLETGELSVGELITASFAELTANRREIAIYLGAFLLVDVAGALIPGSRAWLGSGGLLMLGGYFVGQYLLYRTMLRRAGHAGAESGFHIFRFVGMALMIGIALLFAANLFLIPAIVLAARWIAAPCYVVAADKGAIAAIGESWSVTNGNTLSLSLAFTALALVFFALFVGFAAVESVAQTVLGTRLGFGLAMHVLPLLLMGLSVAAYRRLNHEGKDLAAVFA